MNRNKLMALILVLMLGLSACVSKPESEPEPEASQPAEQIEISADDQTGAEEAAAEEAEEPAAEEPKKPEKKPAGKEPEAVKEYVTISVQGYSSDQSIIYTEGDSVYSILRKCGASISKEKTMYGIYIVGINGLSEGDKGAGSGWTYKVNGEMPMMSADKYVVKAGDSISWEFVTGGI